MSAAGLAAPLRLLFPGAATARVVSLASLLRLAVVAVGGAVLALEPQRIGAGTAVAAASLVALVLWERARGPAGPLVDVVVATGAVLVSGGWQSPFAAVLGVDVAVAGLRGGYPAAARWGLAQTLALLAGTALFHQPLGGQLPLVLMLAGATGGFGDRLLTDSRRDADLALGQLDALRRTNRLLADVHGALGALPAAPDARTVGAVALTHLRREIPFHAAAVLARGTDDGRLEVVHAVGARLSPDGTGLLGDVAALVDATAAGTCRVHGAGTLSGRPGTVTAVPLRVHGEDVGHLVLEHDGAPVDLEALAVAADVVALALDNARWLDRLAILSGEFERTRLARDLHDRLCQSLAAVSIALQRTAARTDDPDLSLLGQQVRDDLADLRETLFELRAGPPAAGDLADSVAGYVDRVTTRAGIAADVDVACPGGRLPLAVEQQLFRILQELLRNTVRHADARHVTVTWRVDEDRAVLEVEDDGAGFDATGVRGDGLRTLRDRADALGARCAVDSQPGAGTVVTVTIDRRPHPQGEPS